jgi:hypothetical protein
MTAADENHPLWGEYCDEHEEEYQDHFCSKLEEGEDMTNKCRYCGRVIYQEKNGEWRSYEGKALWECNKNRDLKHKPK